MSSNKHYNVNFSIYKFDQCIAKLRDEITYARSEKKAVSNVLYRWKKTHGYSSKTSLKVTDISVEEI